MKVLVIGSGAREHCIAWKISRSPQIDKIFCMPGNPGTRDIAENVGTGISVDDFKDIIDFVRKNSIDLTIVGPEAPLVDGIVDVFKENGLRIFGPDGKSSVIEGSKVFTKNFCRKYHIPTADFEVFRKDDSNAAIAKIESMGDDDFPVVVKADGLAAGKGVLIVGSKGEALEAIDDIFNKKVFGQAGNSLIIEDFLEGYEVSILNLCDGISLKPLVLAQDYKRIFDGDKGKNTGGMGSYSPVPFVDSNMRKRILDEIIYPTYEGLREEGIDYEGILYGGILISEGDPYLLEYNCRFGDPETQAILPRMKTDLLQLLVACTEKDLSAKEIEWYEGSCVCTVLASKGYPESSSKGDIISGLDILKEDDEINVFHAGTGLSGDKTVTNGGRVLSIVSMGSDFREARKKVYDAIKIINFEGMQFRKDIAMKVVQNEL